jgi:hypothetical protein
MSVDAAARPARPVGVGLFLAAVAATYSLLPIASGLNVWLSVPDVAFAAAFWGLVGAAATAAVRRRGRLADNPRLLLALAAALWALTECLFTGLIVLKPTRWPPLPWSVPAMGLPALVAGLVSLRALRQARDRRPMVMAPALVIVLSWTTVAALWIWLPRWMRALLGSADAGWYAWGGFDLAWILAGVAAVVLAGAATLGAGRRAITVPAALALTALQLAPALIGPDAPAAAPIRSGAPIVWIIPDSVRADHASAYGYARPTTPNLERLAARGTLVRSHVSSGVRTENTYAKMLAMTPGLDGYQPERPLPLGGGRALLPVGWLPQQPGFLAAMKAAGYQTALYHVYYDLLEDRGLQPWLQDFDRVLKTRLSGDVSVGAYLVRKLVGTSIDGLPQMDRFAVHRRQRMAGEIVGYVERFLADRRDPRPLFLVVHLAGGHFPYYTFDPSHHIAEARPAGKVAAYDDSLRAADDQLGQLLALLERKLPRATTFVFADHGEIFEGTPYLPQHVTVPLVVSPALPAAPTATTSSLDVAATTMALAAGTAPRCDGALARDLRCPAIPGEIRVVDHTGHRRFVVAAVVDGALVAADIKKSEAVVGADPGPAPSPCDFFARIGAGARAIAVSPLERQDGIAARWQRQLERCRLHAAR